MAKKPLKNGNPKLEPLQHTPREKKPPSVVISEPLRHGQLQPLLKPIPKQTVPTQDPPLALHENKVITSDFSFIDKSILSELGTSLGTAVVGYGMPAPNKTPSPLSHEQIRRDLSPTITMGAALGQGSFGEVVSITATQSTTGIPFTAAAKFFSDYSDKGLGEIRHEFNILKSLKDKPGIIQLVNIDLVVQDTLVGYAMEKGDGTLSTELSGAPFSVNDTIKLAKDLVAGGHSLESMGLVHRDCKPSNIVKVSDGNGHFSWKKVDFGLTTQEGAPFKECGTLLYRSPESHGGLNTTDYRTSIKQDVFADGLILAQVLLKNIPSHPDTPKTIIHTQNELPTTPDSSMLMDARCSPHVLPLRVFSEYGPRFYTPAVTRLNAVKAEIPELSALVDLSIKMIDPDPVQRPLFSDCQRILTTAYPS